ncbi:MAG: hypothetical protein J5449_09565 [Oscillospiraceae bacterium]|nr:hypothetical protein [Oscillospiraceae bacterium]
MKPEPKMYRKLMIFSWCLTLLTVALEAYMAYLMKRYPGVEVFERNVRIAGVLLMLWIAASSFFTVMALKNRKK